MVACSSHQITENPTRDLGDHPSAGLCNETMLLRAQRGIFPRVSGGAGEKKETPRWVCSRFRSLHLMFYNALDIRKWRVTVSRCLLPCLASTWPLTPGESACILIMIHEASNSRQTNIQELSETWSTYCLPKAPSVHW